MIEFPANGGTCTGYLALPEPDGANGRGVVVLQEWWGLVPHIKDVADRFAAEGFVALAPDLWHGEQTTNPDEAGRMMMALNVDRAEQELRGAIEALKDEAGIDGKVGVVGFCMGGQLALLAATTRDNQVGAAVDFYGIHPSVKPDFSRLSCPVMGFFGDEDRFVPTTNVEELARDIDAAGGEFDYTIYPGAGHAFFNDTRPEAYESSAASDAWERTLSFLADHLEAEEAGAPVIGGGPNDDEEDAVEIEVEDVEAEEIVAAGEGQDDDDELGAPRTRAGTGGDGDDDDDDDDDDEDEDEDEVASVVEEPDVVEAEEEAERPGVTAVPDAEEEVLVDDDQDDDEDEDEDRVSAAEEEAADEESDVIQPVRETNGASHKPGPPPTPRVPRPAARNTPRKPPPARKPAKPAAKAGARKPAAKAAPARKAAPAKKAAPARKAAAGKKAAPAKKAAPGRKAAAGRKAAPARKAPASAARKASGARKATASRKPVPARKAGARKPVVVRKAAASRTKSSRKRK
ncbi:MAG TPA: dienelactone hydrolase family protein [Kofleriaceae bacterium]|nr:dienelactone hydrolase family protein [Kofleriaceae bacterium]